MESQIQTHSLQATGTCGPGAQTSFVSKHITSAYRVRRVSVHFPLGCAGFVRVYLLVTQDPSSLTTGLPPGMSILSMLSPLDFLIGDDVTLTLHLDLPVTVKSTWLKAHIVNADVFPHHPSAVFTLEEILEP